MANEENFTIVVLDALTQEQITRSMTENEIEQRKAIEEIAKAEQQERANKEAARTSALAKLAALGLTEEEIAAL
jgi:hypothetical protein